MATAPLMLATADGVLYLCRAGDYAVTLTVRDAGGLSDNVTTTVTVVAVVNGAPVADFALPPCVINVACDFVSSSTDDVAVTDMELGLQRRRHCRRDHGQRRVHLYRGGRLQRQSDRA